MNSDNHIFEKIDMRYLKNILKALISLSLLVYLVYEAEPQKIIKVFNDVDFAASFWYILAAFLCVILWIFFMVLRWKVLLTGYNYQVSFSRLSSFYLIGLFFNNFLPTSIGGDVFRIYKIVEEIGDRTIGFASVIIERMLGIAATLLLAVFALFMISQQFHSARLLYISIFLLLSISAFFFIVVRNRPFKILLRIFDKLTFFSIGEKFNKLLEAIHYFQDRRRILLYVLFYSLLSQIAIVYMNYFFVKIFALNVDLSYLFVVVPVTFLLTILPSINGVGVRDLGFVSLLSRVGVIKAAALSLSFMNLIMPMLISVIGAVLFITQKRKTKSGEINAFETSL